MPVTVEQLQDECARQGVELTRPLAKAMGYCQHDDTLVKAFDYVGMDLRKGTGPLVSKPIEGSVWADDTAATAFQQLINSTVEPVPHDSETLSFICEGAKTFSACCYAEEAFAGTIAALDAGDESVGCDIFTSEGVPVFVRKSDGEPSCLSLSDIVINGIPYPKGSIIRIDTSQDLKDGYPTPADDTVRVMDVREIDKIAFVRLSVWALQLEERTAPTMKKFAFREAYTDELWEILTTTTVSDVEASAQEVAERIVRPATKAARFTNHFAILARLARG